MEELEISKLRYEAFGPFKFNVRDDDNHRQALRDFWSERKIDSPVGLQDAVGVYIWTVKDGKRRVPHNVGLTDRQGFAARFLQKETMFLKGTEDADWEVYLLALRSKTGRFRKAVTAKTLKGNDWLETMLISAAFKVNRNLVNKAKVKYLKSAVVEGYLNDDVQARSASARSLNKLLKVDSGKRK